MDLKGSSAVLPVQHYQGTYMRVACGFVRICAQTCEGGRGDVSMAGAVPHVRPGPLPCVTWRPVYASDSNKLKVCPRRLKDFKPLLQAVTRVKTVPATVQLTKTGPEQCRIS